MKKRWGALKRIIGSERPQGVFLSLLDEDGSIVNANINMQKVLNLKNPRHSKINFFNLIPPAQAESFKNTISVVAKEGKPGKIELCLCNGVYHPMKWEVNSIDAGESPVKRFLCIGQKLLDGERTGKFNNFLKNNFQEFFEDKKAGIICRDINGELIAISQSAVEIFNISQERLYQLNNIENLWNTHWMITTERGEPVSFDKTPFMKALRTGTPQKETLFFRLKDGERRSVHYESQPVFEAGLETPFSVVSKIVDVTPEKKQTDVPAVLELVLRGYMEDSPDMSWVVDEEERLVFANHSFCERFEINGSNAIGKKLSELLPPAVADLFFEKNTQVLKSGKFIEAEKKIELAGGMSFNLLIHFFPVNLLSGKKLLGGFAVKLSGKQLVESQLREANERLLNFNRAANDAIWEWDMQAGKTFRNEQLMDMIGYSNEEPKGISWWLRRIHPEDRNRVSDTIKAATDNQSMTWEDQYRFKCASGKFIHIQDRGFIVYENGLPVKMIGSLQDISAIKKLKDQLVDEKLQNQKELSETVIRVQETERRRIGSELHDNVNQILTTTKLFVEMLTPANKNEKDIKKKSIEYLLSAIEEIRKLSRELAAPELKEKSLVDTIRKMVNDINESRAIKVKFVHNAETDLLSPGRKVTLFRILQEQVKNIINYSKAGEATIYLDCNSDVAQLVIRDNGIGFDAQKIKTGIGLASIHDRTNYYSGTVELETASGKGCTLTVKIPAS